MTRSLRARSIGLFNKRPIGCDWPPIRRRRPRLPRLGARGHRQGRAQPAPRQVHARAAPLLCMRQALRLLAPCHANYRSLRFRLCAAPARIAILFTQVKLGVFSELRSVCSRLSPWCRVFGQRVGANATREGKQSVPSGSRNALFAFLGSSQTLVSSVADAESCRSIICGLY